MTLSNTIRFIERVALLQPAVKSVVPNDIFRLNATPDAEYAAFGWTQGQHTIGVDDSYATYAFTFFYVDRLTADKSNELEIQSVGIQVLDNVVKMLERAGAHCATSYTFTTFNQRFLDECAGVYTQVQLQVPLNGICEEGYYDFNEDFNDDFATTGMAMGDEPFGDYLGPNGGGVNYPGGGGCGCPPIPANLLKYHLCADEAEYEAIDPKDPGTLYLIPEA